MATGRRKPTSTSTFCSALGVYPWPHDAAEVKRVCREMFGDLNKDHLAAARQQLLGLVLIELLVTKDVQEDFVGGFSQDWPPNAESQAPYDESFWTADGAEKLDTFDPPKRLPYRVVFFLHEYDAARPLYAGASGLVPLPAISPLPDRLRSQVQYVVP